MILSQTQLHNKPRIISELKKHDVNKVCPGLPSTPVLGAGAHYSQANFSKPHISGEVLVELHQSPEQSLKFVEVRDGHLVVYNSRLPELKLALHHLNLQADPGGRAWTFCLTKQSMDNTTPIVTITTSSQQDYDRWVKTLAAELLSQTPLEAVRFLDILGITATLESFKPTVTSSKLSPEDCKLPLPRSRHHSHSSDHSPSPLPDVVKDLPSSHLPTGGRRPSQPPRDKEHPEWFHQRLLLFESLCKHSGSSNLMPSIATTNNTLLVTPCNLTAKQRATSCHNLSQCNILPVKDICKYFEEKNQNYLAPPQGPTIEDLTLVVPTRDHEVAKRRFSHLDHTFTPLVRLTKHIS
uniref:PH domain-containing protein n=1 Tax=Cacopsylla melanoneura TaxID=428564 RepID=A0A8D8SSA3_9HEMI